MISYCGLCCDTCPIYLATRETDKTRQLIMREAIAEECAKLYGTHTTVAEITDCDGCRSLTGILFSGCVNCEIRKCDKIKELENCTLCSEYVCEKLKRHFTLDPDAEIRIGKMKTAN